MSSKKKIHWIDRGFTNFLSKIQDDIIEGETIIENLKHNRNSIEIELKSRIKK